MTWTELELTGRSRTHIVERQDLACPIHRAAAQPFLKMRAAAAGAGIDLAVTSGFRDFDAQMLIWNEKFRGLRPLYDRNGVLLDYSVLTPEQVMEATLHWSALPGGSRHHWGTEVDVFDRAALPQGRPKLVPAEYGPGGPFEKLTVWLDGNLQRFGFFRPYGADRGGVSPEAWHLSYAPESIPALEQLTLDVLERAVRGSEIEGKALVLEGLPEIYRRYLTNIDNP